jgi:AcrR family transcriptional regulator
MTRMSVSRQEGGRVNQKRRTRAAIVQGAIELARKGTIPTVADAAEAALVSRATAYRYFPTQDSLTLEIADVTPGMEPIEAAVAQLAGDDAVARVEELVIVANKTFFAEEAHQRTALRLYLEQWSERRRQGEESPVLRAGRRLGWLDRALEPLRERLDREELVRLRAALALTMGVEALVVMKDVCQLDDEAAFDVLRDTALSIIRTMRNRGGPAPDEAGARATSMLTWGRSASEQLGVGRHGAVQNADHVARGSDSH